MQEINSEVRKILKDNKIEENAGLLVLLGIYYGLDIDTVCPEETVKAINLTKIVVTDFRHSNSLKWNVPLFIGQQTEWDWVKKYNALWDRFKSRKDADSDVLKTMQEWFKKHPLYRVADVQKATEAYLMTVKEEQYCKRSLNFIFDGKGATRTSPLLAWCEKTVVTNNDPSMRGTIIR